VPSNVILMLSDVSMDDWIALCRHDGDAVDACEVFGRNKDGERVPEDMPI